METLDVICINCESVIADHEIDLHSKICLQPIKPLSSNPKKSELIYCNFKFSQLSKGLQKVALSDKSPYVQESVKFFISLCQTVSKEEEISDRILQTTLKLMNTLKNYGFVDSPSQILMIYSKRLKNCLKDKIKLLNSHLMSNNRVRLSGNIKELLETNEKTLSELDKEIINHKNLKKELERSIEKVSVVNSFLDCSVNSSSFHSRNSSIGSLSSLTELDFNKSANEIFEGNKRIFYSKCLTAKLKFGSKDPAQLIQLSDLYEYVKKRKISIDYWDEFITNELKKPTKWLKK